MGQVFLQIVAVGYLLLFYGVLYIVGYKYFLWLCLRWRAPWADHLFPIARRSTVFALLPLIGASLMVAFGAFGSASDEGKVIFAVAFLAFPALLAFQALMTARHDAPAIDDRNPAGANPVPWSEDDT